jgi:hypothetical protein
MNIIYEHGEQSEVLRSQNIQQPNSLSVRQKQVTAKKCRKRRIAEIIDSDATAADLRDADAGEGLMLVAETLSSVQSNSAPTGAQAVTDLIMPFVTARLDELDANLTQRLDGIDQRLDGIDQRLNQIDGSMAQGFDIISSNMHAAFVNIHATREIDPIRPMLILGGSQVPVGFPQTRRTLFSLNGAITKTLLNYYGIVNNGSVVQKIDALAAHLGLPPRQ